ncbi:hypothetical protein RHSIM_Rhsim08G0048800 [Rhododendron simsii]|uniref:Uncharacterized protein n=1 Tax=Rhododendron simsii TaxID=118357 RepID=A0A834GP68_RHOSS|nr:hypothetical protein RHSIM_Rhsim08G0048800 [Rhododendron simsii]
MAMASSFAAIYKFFVYIISHSHGRPGFYAERRRGTEVKSTPTKSLKLRLRPRALAFVALPPFKNLQCGESVTIEGQAYTISAVTHRYQLRKGKYEPSEKRLDVLSTGRYILNLYLENLLEKS